MLGDYPEMGIEIAREKTWHIRIKAAGVGKKGRGEISLIELIDKYDKLAPKPSTWPKMKITLLHVFRPYCALSVTELRSNDFQNYIVSYPAQLIIRRGLSMLRTILPWGEDNGFY